eukprot:CAMPEP_0168317912 /NCGR_PEP_ID=MMETSP0213-20121227/165_1 /TAXON_ID=151035 /ORGANISM="Euplotes harpa, Strain FSP1.4" /LENGTH=179 /DNA_ID=CAMNT_0008318877 /DNA_START=217 /DNA_END=755 /DNA_ORIENTATION=+
MASTCPNTWSTRQTSKLTNDVTAYFEYTPGEDFPEVIDYCKSIETEYGIVIEKYENKIISDLEVLVNEQNVSTVLLGNRRTDPYSEHLLPIQRSSKGWPDFLRVHPLIDWEYGEVWRFISHFKLRVCCLYELGYTSLGTISKTRKNPHLLVPSSGEGPAEYYPAWLLKDGSKERESRVS